MSKIYNISIVLSFAGLWITSIFSDEMEIILGFILIFSFGILHGSNDILLINSISNSKLEHPFFKVLLIYLLTVLSAVILFYFFPIIALTLFIGFSAFHFGEQHWSYRNILTSSKIENSFYFIYGLLVLQILFVLNTDEVIEIVESISEFTITADFVLYSFIGNVILFMIAAGYLSLRSNNFKYSILSEFFYLLIFTIIFNVSTLIWGFTIYFILWHSIPSLFEQVTFIYGDFNKKSVFEYFKKALPYWLISLVGISIVYFIFKGEKMFYAVFFSFIAAVTFPHALVINKMFSNKKTQSSK